MSNSTTVIPATIPISTIVPVFPGAVTIPTDSFWGARRHTNRTITLASQHALLISTGRMKTLDPCHIGERASFWDSDIAKWLEAVCTEVASGTCTPALRRAADQAMEGFAAIQAGDGYMGSWLHHRPQARYQNHRDDHELYSMGHVLEACTAHAQAGMGDLGTRVAEKMIDHLWRNFGPAGRPAYCGHPEIEVALIRWWKYSGDQRAFILSQRQVDARGHQPHLFDSEARVRGEEATKHWSWGGERGWNYYQAHLPVREQREATGHAVRALYLYAGMADLAAAGDQSLIQALKSLWDDAVHKRMYVTGGMGSTKNGEAFGGEFELPDDTAYCETCASIALARWGLRMLSLEQSVEYGDVMELALHNTVLAGVDLTGERYFYSNPLAVSPQHRRGNEEHMSSQRQSWFGCACCPPNIARTLSQLGEFVYGVNEDTVAVHLYVSGSLTISLAGVRTRLDIISALPWSGEVQIQIHPEQPIHATMALRLPGWCSNPEIAINQEHVAVQASTYARLSRLWRAGDCVTMNLPMATQRVYGHPAVRAISGKVAFKRGPLVYCIEGHDAGIYLDDLSIPDDSVISVEHSPAPGGYSKLHMTAQHCDPRSWDGGLYRETPPPQVPLTVEAIPYCLWGNRSEGEMRVWIRRS